jgi:hypothetical protein
MGGAFGRQTVPAFLIDPPGDGAGVRAVVGLNAAPADRNEAGAEVGGARTKRRHSHTLAHTYLWRYRRHRGNGRNLNISQLDMGFQAASILAEGVVIMATPFGRGGREP